MKKPSKPKPKPNSPKDEQSGNLGFDDVLRRMLETPPTKHATKKGPKKSGPKT